MLFDRSRNRPFHLGRFPLEVLRRKPALLAEEAARPRLDAPVPCAGTGLLAESAGRYFDRFMRHRQAEVAKARAPVPDDLARRSVDIKGGIYFLDAAHAGICALPPAAWIMDREIPGHSHAIVIVVEQGRIPEPGNPAHAWLQGAPASLALTRAAGIAVNIASYLGQLGFTATAHAGTVSDVDLDRLAVLAGVCCRGRAAVLSPWLGDRIALAAVTTDYELATDLPLAPVFDAGRGLRYWLGINGAESGRERRRRACRPSHLGPWPLERLPRVERPTTLIIDDEVPRVPHRASFFERALKGDLGPRAQAERYRFAYKNPSAMAYVQLIRSMVPHQDGPVAATGNGGRSDPLANARAVKSLAYALGADAVGICAIPRYAWYSHRPDGTPIEPYHRYAVVMLIDQGFGTMEGASGDDWISGSQSMRAYMRGAEIAGIMADFLRAAGFPARSHTNVDSDVLHIPLLLWAGLGELSRIGELVLHPYLGPRVKSVVLTTDLPLALDQPLDFGLQYFCSHCLKCARECPCDAIPVQQAVMFNGYQMWKIDAERCARYRLTNAKGAGCGRCMKSCPLNKVYDADAPAVIRIAHWLGMHVRRLQSVLVPAAVYLDDRLGYGRRNPLKKWWLDLELVNGVAVHPRRGVNQRDIDYHRRLNTSREKIVYYHASMMPPPDQMDAHPVDRNAAREAVALMESVEQARERIAAGGRTPSHYQPTPSSHDVNRPPD